MSELKRNWSPCKICKKYYDYSCNKSIKNCKNFIPENSFRNFLAKNGYKVDPHVSFIDDIYFIEKDFVIPSDIKNFADLRNKKFDIIYETLHYKVDFIHTFFLSIDEDVRNLIYNDDYVMSNYNINMIIDKDVKKSLKYRLDERFNYITSLNS